VDEEYDSPFMQEARRNGFDVEGWEKAQGKMLVGGKMDDIAAGAYTRFHFRST
jgi:hypothetical protein